MNNFVKVEWRLRLRKLSDTLCSWHKQSDTAVREWCHMTEIGLQHIYHRILRGMILELEKAGYKKAKLHEVVIERPVDSPYFSSKLAESKLRKNLEIEMSHSVQLLEKLEEEMTRRRLMEDEIYKLKLEINEFKTHTDKAIIIPLTSRSIQFPLKGLSPKISPRSNLLGSLSNLDQFHRRQDMHVEDENLVFSARSDPHPIQMTPRREQDFRRNPHFELIPEVKDIIFEAKPSNVAKDFKALFDIEWTKLYVDMRKLYSEQYVIDLLLSWLKDCYLTCIAVTEEQRETIRENALKCFKRYTNGLRSFRLPNTSTNSIKEFQNKVAQDAVPFIIKVCERRLLGGEQNADYPLMYVRKCAELCWLMCTQTPPMVLNFQIEKGDLINRKLFVSLVPRGEKVDCLVWPAVMRNTEGHVLERGVVKTAVS